MGGQARARWRLGPMGVSARVLVGGYLLWEVLGSPVPDRVDGSLVLGLLGFPTILLAWQWWRSRRHPEPLRATGPVASVMNLAAVAALYSTPWYLPALSVTSDAAMIFYGASMLLAAARGYAGCEVLAVSNWVLRRDDQIGCLVFAPVDALERRRNRRHGKESIRS
ncbi:MAG: hypothetical protein ACRDP9_09050 [Kribbellaceae bacterium]